MKRTFIILLIILSVKQLRSQCWSSASAGINHTFGIMTDGTLWAWGYNESGRLGDGSAIDKNFPVRIGTASNWKLVTAGDGHSLGIKTDGTLWAWGQNYY